MQKSKHTKKSRQIKKCKHMEKVSFEGSFYCVCTSPNGGSYKYNPKYENVIRRFNLFVMGSQNRRHEHGNWWELCVNGQAPFTGVTPTKCVYY